VTRLTRIVASVTTLVPLAAVLFATPAAAADTTSCTRTLLCAPVNAPLLDVDGPLTDGPLVAVAGNIDDA
jgi:hypothetical protein